MPVHALRLNAGRFPADAGVSELVDELAKTSSEFRTLWEEHSVGSLPRAYKVFVHPEGGASS
ncbi:hypothetical protein [Actinacidiphila glaucinigra]|uniref:MmyB family transcriptional regulator n=1 Tax=Actinacidiphila glaucinigra TaxID=235986 RepID=UPI00370F8F18